MLAADKDRLIYNIKRQALALRKQELEMIVILRMNRASSWSSCASSRHRVHGGEASVNLLKSTQPTEGRRPPRNVVDRTM